MTTPAGWYPDAQGTMRFWDGASWTPHTAPPAPAQDAQDVLPVAASAMPPTVWQANPATSALTSVQVASSPDANGVAVAGFVIGLVSVFLPLVFGLVGGLAGLTLSIVGLALPFRRRGLAIAGLVLSILAIVLIF